MQIKIILILLFLSLEAYADDSCLNPHMIIRELAAIQGKQKAEQVLALLRKDSSATPLKQFETTKSNWVVLNNNATKVLGDLPAGTRVELRLKDGTIKVVYLQGRGVNGKLGYSDFAESPSGRIIYKQFDEAQLAVSGYKYLPEGTVTDTLVLRALTKSEATEAPAAIAGADLKTEVFLRTGTAVNSSEGANYVANSREALDYFDDEYRAISSVTSKPLTSAEFTEMTNNMHRILSQGKLGNRGYKAKEPGKIRTDEVGMVSTRAPAYDYTARLLERYRLKPTETYYRNKIEGISEKALPGNSVSGRHEYPAGTHMKEYYTRGAELFNKVMSEMRSSYPRKEVIMEDLGDYYHVMVNARPYDRANNSLFMSQANYIMTRLGLPSTSHGDLDHVFMRVGTDDARVLWREFTSGSLPSSQSFGLNIR